MSNIIIFGVLIVGLILGLGVNYFDFITKNFKYENSKISRTDLVKFFKVHETGYILENSRWKLTKDNCFHISSGPRDYYAEWVCEDGKYNLYISGYESTSWKNKKFLTSVNTIFEMFEYICKNKDPLE